MNQIDPVTLAEKIIALLDSSKYVATYKWATLDAIFQTVSESIDDAGNAPTEISAKRVGTHVMETYWKQAVPFTADANGKPIFLRQSSTGKHMDIPQIIAEYRKSNGLSSKNDSIDRAKQLDPPGILKLEREVQSRVIGQPLSKLQRFGNGSKFIEDRFIYDFSWKDEESSGKIHKMDFDDSIRFKPGVSQGLLRVQSLLRPYIENLWIQKVADKNRDITDAASLEDFLFGTERAVHTKIRPYLTAMQNQICFYCDGLLSEKCDVDHFLPFSKHRLESLDNLVASCRTCNGDKSASYVSMRHLTKWLLRFTPGKVSKQIDAIASATGYLRKSSETLNIARSVYFFKPEGLALWDQLFGTVALSHDEAHAAMDGLLS